MLNDIVLDLAGTNTPTLENLHIFSSNNEATAPSVGVYYGRQADGKPAANAKFVNLSIQGSFSKAAIINFASEVSSEVNCRYFNNHTSEKAYAAVYTDNMQTLADHFHTDSTDDSDPPVPVLGVISRYTDLPTGDKHHSNILHHTSQLHVQRPSKFAPAIDTITSTGTTVTVQFKSADLDKFNDASFTTDKYVFLNKVLAGSEVIKELNNKSLMPSAIGTLELTFNVELDLSLYPTTGFSGFGRNQTGPAMLIAGAKSLHGRAGYILTYGNSSIVFDCVNGSGIRQFDLNFQQENNPDKPLKFELPNSGTVVQGFHVELLSNAQNFDTAILETIQPDGLDDGFIRFDNFSFRVANMGEPSASAKVFESPGKVRLKNAIIEVPLEVVLNDISEFMSFTGVMVAQDTNERREYQSNSVIELETEDRLQAPIKATFIDQPGSSETHKSGPFIDVIRQNDNVASDDIIGGYRYVGYDDADPGNEQIYAMTRGQIWDATEGSHSGALDIKISDAGDMKDVAQFAPFNGTVRQTSLLLRYIVGGDEKFRRVILGPVDTAGTGFRALGVPNS